MTGKNIRTVSRLAKEVGTSLRSAIITFQQSNVSYCKVIKFKNFDASGREYLFIFNNCYNYGHLRTRDLSSSRLFAELAETSLFNYCRLVTFSEDLYNSYDAQNIINGITLLPESFEEDYKDFTKTNLKTLKQLFGKYGISDDDSIGKILFSLTNGSKNFFVWAANLYFHGSSSLHDIKRIMYWEEAYRQLVKRLSKGTITAYTSSKDISLLFTEMMLLRREKRITDVINSFNTAQKKILREVEMDENTKKIFSSFYRLSEGKKINFIQKMSTIDDASEIIHQMSHVTGTHFSWSKESFIDYINNVDCINCEKIYENGDIIVVKVNDFETIKNLAKTTNWCISKNKTYWNNYVGMLGDAEQFMLFDFSQKEDSLYSIVGFTCRYNKGITNAHDFTNNDMLFQRTSFDPTLINSYVSHLIKEEGIYSFLQSLNVDVNLMVKYEKPLFEWNKESMYKYLYECVDKNNVIVLCDDGNKVAISVKDKGVRYFIGDSYIDNIDSDLYGRKHIIFMDFSSQQCNANKLVFAIINEGRDGEDDSVILMANQHCISVPELFDSKLALFKLPYDTIKRMDNITVKLASALETFNMKDAEKYATDNAMIIKTIQYGIGSENMSCTIRKSFSSCVSFDYLDFFYNRKLSLSDAMGVYNTSNLLGSTLLLFCGCFRNRNCQMPSQKEIHKLFNREFTNIEDAKKVCYFLAIDRMMTKEITDNTPSIHICSEIMDTILSNKCKGKAIDYFVSKILDVVEKLPANQTMKKVIIYSVDSASTKLKERVQALKGKGCVIDSWLESSQPNTETNVWENELPVEEGGLFGAMGQQMEIEHPMFINQEVGHFQLEAPRELEFNQFFNDLPVEGNGEEEYAEAF